MSTNGTNSTHALPDFDNPGKSVTRPVSLAHVVLRANDFPAMRQFYLTFFSARVAHENPMICFLAYDDEHHRIALANTQAPGKTAPKDSPLLHIAFTFADLGALLLAYRQRLLHGIRPFWCVNHGPTISLYYRDPEGNVIETQHDVFATAEEASAFMLSEEFIENPIGADFDPEDMIARLRAGEEERVVVERPKIGPRGMDTVPH